MAEIIIITVIIIIVIKMCSSTSNGYGVGDTYHGDWPPEDGGTWHLDHAGDERGDTDWRKVGD